MKRTTCFMERPWAAMALAALCALAWAFAFPLIKLGMVEFAISGEDVGAKTLLAGLRFTVAGLVALCVGAA